MDNGRPSLTPEAQREILLARITATIGQLPDSWEIDRAACYLLASDTSEAKDALRGVVCSLLNKPYIADPGFWQKLDTWLDTSPLDRCLAHVKAFERIDALAMYSPKDSEVEQLADVLLNFVDRAPETAEPLFGHYVLCAIFMLNEADPATATRLLPRIKPSRWIERLEYDALTKRLSEGGETTFPATIRPQWVRNLPPVIGRDPIGGALMRVVLAADPCDVLAKTWIGDAPGKWLIYGDLDNLKELNDTLGYLGADLAIRGTVQTLQEAMGDRVIRFGGDEFIIFDDGPDGPELAELLRRKIEATEYAPLGHLVEPVSVTISLGVTRSGNLAECLRAAEDAVREAKLKGRNQIVVAE